MTMVEPRVSDRFDDEPLFIEGMRALATSLVVVAVSCHADQVTRAPVCTEQLGTWCWTYVGPPGIPVTAVAASSNGLVIGTTDGVWWYDVTTYSLSHSGLRGKTVTSLLVDNVHPTLATVAPHGLDTTLSVLYSATDVAGGRWSPADGGIAAARGYYESAYSVARSSFNPQQLFLGLGNAPILRSDDGGASWRYVLGGQNTLGGPVLSLAVSGQLRGRVWAGGQDVQSLLYVIRSDDSGGTWQTANPQPQTPDAAFILDAVHYDASEVLLAGLSRTILLTKDGGNTWSPWFTPGSSTTAVSFGHVGDTVAVVASANLGAGPGTSSLLQVFITADLGQNWDTLPVPPVATGGTSIAWAGGGGLYIGTYSGLWIVSVRQ